MPIPHNSPSFFASSSSLVSVRKKYQRGAPSGRNRRRAVDEHVRTRRSSVVRRLHLARGRAARAVFHRLVFGRDRAQGHR
eukprot:7210840-Prymnesium_polylepis.1